MLAEVGWCITPYTATCYNATSVQLGQRVEKIIEGEIAYTRICRDVQEGPKTLFLPLFERIMTNWISIRFDLQRGP